MKFATYDKDQIITGFYDDKIHGDKIPSGAVGISEDNWRLATSDGTARWVIDINSGEVSLKPDSEEEIAAKKAFAETAKLSAYRTAVGAHIDGKAREFGFDSIVTAVTYADEPADPLNQSYGHALRAWRSKCWEKCREVLATWQGGGAEPTVEDLIASLPAFVAP